MPEKVKRGLQGAAINSPARAALTKCFSSSMRRNFPRYIDCLGDDTGQAWIWRHVHRSLLSLSATGSVHRFAGDDEPMRIGGSARRGRRLRFGGEASMEGPPSKSHP